jgi:hypothetical protein
LEEAAKFAVDELYRRLHPDNGLPADRAAELIVEESDRLANLHVTYVARLEELVGEDEALRLLTQQAEKGSQDGKDKG